MQSFSELKPQTMIIVAPPGAGKTTQVPPVLLKQVSGQVLVLEPRRMAAVAAVHRIAEEQGWQVGREIGYQIRFENQTSRDTRLIFMTEALLSRRMLRDPELRGVDVVILDEFHERSLDVDMALGLLKELSDLGRGIHIVVMSATLQTEALAKYLGGAPVVSVEFPRHPLTIHHQQRSQHLKTDPAFYETVETAVHQALREREGDVLVFLPGTREIENLRRKLADRLSSDQLEIRPLHGSLPLKEQQLALRKSSRRKLVLATNIAESSVTVEGVRCVIDTGLAKVVWQNRASGFSHLNLTRIARDNADQRAGRAAREGPGTCYRLWSASEENAMAPTLIPEVHRVQLTGPLLNLAAHGVTSPEEFSWFEKPDPRHLEAARTELQRLGALSPDSALTDQGREMAQLPVPPRLARLLLEGRQQGRATLAARLSAILSEPDFFHSQSTESYLPLQYECDISLRLAVLGEWEERSGHVDVDTVRARRVQQATAQILKALKAPADQRGDPAELLPAVRQLMVAAFPDRICRRRGSSDRGRMVGGRGVRLSSTTVVRESEFFLALDGRDRSGDPETLVDLACGLTREELLDAFEDQVSLVEEMVFDEEKQKFTLRRTRQIFGLPIEDPIISAPRPEQMEPALAEFLIGRLDWAAERSSGLGEWLQRWRFFHRQTGSEETDLTPAKIRAAFEAAVVGRSSLDEVLNLNLASYFEMSFSSDLVHRFQKEVPREVQWPGGKKSKVEWDERGEPFTQVRIQDAFGQSQTPTLLSGKVPLRLYLLGPNFRPVQVTSNIESFWNSGYPEVRKELRARYPKHNWPENPREIVPPLRKRSRS